MAKVIKKSATAKAVKQTKKAPVKTYEEMLLVKTVKDTIVIIEQWIKKHSDLSVVVYSNWFIGISESENKTDGLNFLQSYNVGSNDIALTIEKYFQQKNMHWNDYKIGMTSKTKHVYIHKPR